MSEEEVWSHGVFWEWRKNISGLHAVASVPFIQGLLLRCKHFGKAHWDRWADGLLPSVYIFWILEFLLLSNETSAIVMILGTSVFFLWLLEVFRIWKEASLISCSQNPAVSCPQCKLPVNEWAGHLTPWGSTSGSSDHQLLCLELSHAPVSMMNPECKCKALTSLFVSSSSLLASNIQQVWWSPLKNGAQL